MLRFSHGSQSFVIFFLLLQLDLEADLQGHTSSAIMLGPYFSIQVMTLARAKPRSCGEYWRPLG
jgi:hypothetical protein